jgi:hypothetical protein
VSCSQSRPGPHSSSRWSRYDDTFAAPARRLRAAILADPGALLYLTRNNARGALWEARGNLAHLGSFVYQLLGRLRGRRTYGFRYVETLLTSEEQALLAAAWPSELSQAENRRATRALWAWTKYVWGEAERVLGQPLDVEVDEEGMLAAIERMYE